MNLDFLDFLTISIVLLSTLGIGLYAGRNIKDMASFSVGSRSYGVFALFATLSASYIGGGYTFGISAEVYQIGIVSAFCLFGFSLQQMLVAGVIAPRMSAFKEAISAGDIMRSSYGKWGQVITGVSSAVVCMGITGAQVGATGYVFKTFLGLDQSLGIFIGCGIVLVYSVLGGMKAVVATDILQFCILIVAIPLALFFGIYKLGGLEAILSQLPPTHLEIPGNLSWLEVISLFLSLLLGEALVPPYVQRLLIGKSPEVTRQSIFASAFVSLPFFTIAGGLGILAYAMNAKMDPNLALPAVIEGVLPSGLRGFAVAGIICVIMSSADSFLNSSAISIVNDIIKPLSRKPLSSEKELSLTRYTTLIIGLGSIIFALSIKSVLDILLYSYNFWAPVILVPLVMTLLGKKIPFWGFLVSSFSGLLGVLLGNSLFQDSGLDGLVIGTFCHLVVFLSILYSSSRVHFK